MGAGFEFQFSMSFYSVLSQGGTTEEAFPHTYWLTDELKLYFKSVKVAPPR